MVANLEVPPRTPIDTVVVILNINLTMIFIDIFNHHDS